MAKRGGSLPKRLREDAIVEALLEIRFQSQPIPELFWGRLIDRPEWMHFTQRRLPAYDVPVQIREFDQSLRFTPLIELIAPDGKAALKIGPSVLSYHRTAPYVGWERFEGELEGVIDSLFVTSPNVVVERIGFRYLNAMTSEKHGVNSVGDLDLKLSVADDPISNSVNINFMTQVASDALCTVRVATTEFIQGHIPPDATVFVDVDVFTTEGFRVSEPESTKRWVRDAHAFEKAAFFGLIRESDIERMREE